MNTTTDAGTQVRVSPRDDSPAKRLAELRATLLGGRGPGASDEEVSDHTRNRPWLGSVSAPVERALVQRQTEDVRAGEPVVNDSVLREGRSRSVRAALLGAAVALSIRAVVVRRVRARLGRRD
ncbi:hypothetical protein BA895_07990 [Humibacillus sp. DSM 29435]|nr:hypothetical protein BA895_07990 [Humibacillus sp. DSM 29435]